MRQPNRANNALEAIVYSTGGEVISNKNALSIALEVGSSGGYTLSAGDGITVQSTFGGYTLSLAQYGASGFGKLVSALFVTEIGAKQSDSYLSRTAVTGRPDLNQMRTNIDMSGKLPRGVKRGAHPNAREHSQRCGGNNFGLRMADRGLNVCAL